MSFVILTSSIIFVIISRITIRIPYEGLASLEQAIRKLTRSIRMAIGKEGETARTHSFLIVAS